MRHSASSKRRVGSIDVLKFLLALVIIAYHTGDTFGGDSAPLSNGDFAVEVFFVISGCLMCMSAFRDAQRSTRGLGEDTASFMWRKIKALLVPYLVILFIYFSTWVVATGLDVLEESGPIGLINAMILLLPNFLLTTLAGVNIDSRLVGISWYISAMLIIMLATYPLVRKFGRTYTLVVAPFVALFFLGLMYHYSDGYFGGIYGYLLYIPRGLVRAIIGINMGCVAYEICNKLKSLELTAFARVLLLVAVLALGVGLVFVFQHGDKLTYYSYELLLPLLIGIMFSQQMAGDAIFNNPVSTYLGKSSIYLYLYHTAVRRVCVLAHLPLSYAEALVVLVVGSFLLFVLTDLVERAVRSVFSRHGIKVSRLFVKTSE